MTVIDSYLDTLFAPYPDSERMRSAREELRGMMEDKQHDLLASGATEAQAVGQVIAEFGNLDEVADLLGIQRDIDGDAPLPPAEQGPPPLTMERAEAYVQRVKDSQILTAISTPLFVLSPTVMLFLLWIAESGGPLSDSVAVGIGLAALLMIIAAGVLLGMRRDARLRPFQDIEDGEFTLTRPVRQYAERLWDDERTGTGKGVAVALFILSPLCVILPPLLTGDDMRLRPRPDQLTLFDGGSLAILGVVGTLVLISLGLFCWIAPNGTERATETLLQKYDEYGLEISTSPVLRAVAALWWPVTVAAFLIWGLGFDGWDRAWILFPIAGILYGALWGLAGALSGGDEKPARRH